MMNLSKDQANNSYLIRWTWIELATPAQVFQFKKPLVVLNPLRHWLNNLEIDNSNLAHRLCQLIPAQCPFERDIKVLGYTLFHIPPLCKLNPVYEEVVALRFRALCYLADKCGEDISAYC